MADRPMSAQQIAVVALCVLINTIDGFDILAISFAAPAIVREWGLTPERTGFMLSSGLAGIGIGALLSPPTLGAAAFGAVMTLAVREPRRHR